MQKQKNKPINKKKTKSKSKTVNQVKKTLKKNHKGLYNVLTVIIFLIILSYAIFSFLNSNNNQNNYSSKQNEDGYYYYTLVNQEDYYYEANNLIANQLRVKLHEIINNGFQSISYGDARYVLEKADQLVDDDTKVYKIYDGKTSPSTWDGSSWHREHVWPNSRLGIERVTNNSKNQGSDLHNLRAITPSVNSSKSDRHFDQGSGNNQTTSNQGYYPGDDHKGDVARILFYMAIMYDFLILTDDNLTDTSNHYEMDGAKMGKLSLLLIWHKEDPVDDFERRRNQVIYEEQGNRNPFIDKPEYVHLIWENKSINDLLEPITVYNLHIIALIDKKKDLLYV